MVKIIRLNIKNPAISKVFREIGYADELGSGMRNSYKYTRMYSDAEPEFIEGDVFKIVIPLSVGAMTKVGPQNIPNDGGEVSNQVDKSSGQVQSVINVVKLDASKLKRLLDYCIEARTRAELQKICGISSRDYFSKHVLDPLLDSGLLKRTIPDKPKSSNQKYVKA